MCSAASSDNLYAGNHPYPLLCYTGSYPYSIANKPCSDAWLICFRFAADAVASAAIWMACALFGCRPGDNRRRGCKWVGMPMLAVLERGPLLRGFCDCFFPSVGFLGGINPPSETGTPDPRWIVWPYCIRPPSLTVNHSAEIGSLHSELSFRVQRGISHSERRRCLTRRFFGHYAASE